MVLAIPKRKGGPTMSRQCGWGGGLKTPSRVKAGPMRNGEGECVFGGQLQSHFVASKHPACVLLWLSVVTTTPNASSLAGQIHHRTGSVAGIC